MLTPYRWKYRVLVVLNEDEEFRASQKGVLDKDIPGLLERDMLVFGLGGENGLYKEIDDSSLEELRALNELTGSSVALFGKDGSVKARWKMTASISELFDIIDDMPMRKKEMREKARGMSR